MHMQWNLLIKYKNLYIFCLWCHVEAYCFHFAQMIYRILMQTFCEKFFHFNATWYTNCLHARHYIILDDIFSVRCTEKICKWHIVLEYWKVHFTFICFVMRLLRQYSCGYKVVLIKYFMHNHYSFYDARITRTEIFRIFYILNNAYWFKDYFLPIRNVFVGKMVKRIRKWREAATYSRNVSQVYANWRLQMYIDIWFVFTRFCVYLSCTKKSVTLISLGSLKLEWYC